MSELNLIEAVTGPAFTGEAPQGPPLPPDWAAGFRVYDRDDGEERDGDEE